jgi:hypothetical protein
VNRFALHIWAATVYLRREYLSNVRRDRADAVGLESIAVGFRRSNNLPYTEYTESCVLQMAITNDILSWDVRLHRLIEKADNAARSTHLGAAAATALLNELGNDLNTFIASTSFAMQQSREQNYKTPRCCGAMQLIGVRCIGAGQTIRHDANECNRFARS